MFSGMRRCLPAELSFFSFASHFSRYSALKARWLTSLQPGDSCPLKPRSPSARLGLEGIVCKRKDSPYRSGRRSGGIKVKTREWKVANQYRAKLFAKT